MKKLILIIGIILLCGIAQGTINITASNISDNYILWTWDRGVVLSNMSIDGYNVINIDKNTNSFILSELEANSIHTIKIMTPNDSGSEVSSTLPSTKSSDLILDFMHYYILLFVTIVLLLIGFKIPLGSIIALIFAFSGLLLAIAARDFNMLIMFVCCLVGSSVVTYIGVR